MYFLFRKEVAKSQDENWGAWAEGKMEYFPGKRANMDRN